MRAKVESNSFQSCGVVRPKSEARNTMEVAHVGGRDLIMGAIGGGLQGLYQQEAGTGSRSRESNPGTPSRDMGTSTGVFTVRPEAHPQIKSF